MYFFNFTFNIMVALQIVIIDRHNYLEHSQGFLFYFQSTFLGYTYNRIL